VDCVRWMGDLIVSKSVTNKILVWQPDIKDDIVGTKGFVHLLHVGFCVEPTFSVFAWYSGTRIVIRRQQRGYINAPRSSRRDWPATL